MDKQAKTTIELTLTAIEVRKMIEAQYPGLELPGAPVSFSMVGSSNSQYSDVDTRLHVRWVRNVPLEEGAGS